MTDDLTLLPAEPEVPPGPSEVRRIFFGADGLRAGWSLLIFIALFAAFIFCANIIGHHFRPGAPKTPKPSLEMFGASHVLIVEAIPLAIVLLVSWIMSKIEGRPTSVYGLGGKRKLARFLAGLVWGVACLSLLVIILLKTGLLVIDGRLLFGGEMLRYGALWLLAFLMVGMLEEYLTRGYVQYTLTRGLEGAYQWAFEGRQSRVLGFWTSAAIVAILFGLGHGSNKGESPIGILSAGLAALVFCFSLWRTGSLWWAIGFHTAWDWAQSFLYGVADSGMMVQNHLLATHPAGRPILSGGATGPEGSIFILAILSLVSLVIFFTLPGPGYGGNTDGSKKLQPGDA